MALLAGVFVAVVSASPPAAAPIPGGDITVVCTGTTIGTTFTLTADCGEVTTSLTVPATITTVDGDDFTISATDPVGGQWTGAILTNASAGQTMNILDLNITGSAAGFAVCLNSGLTLVRILFGDASGTIDNVTVDNIWQQPNPASPSCQTGRAIVARGDGTPRTR